MSFQKLLLLLFILISNVAFAHQDFYIIKDFNNVKVRIKTGYEYEEIKKCWIIGELAKILCQNLNYTKPVFIDFNHYYVGYCEPDYFLSFDDGSIIEDWNLDKREPPLKQKALVVREVSRQFNPSATLMLLEYSIINVSRIQADQKVIEYNQNYCSWKIKSMDTLQTKFIALEKSSKIVSDVLMNKIYRQYDKSEKAKNDISYYFQNNKHHIFYNKYKGKDSVLLVVDNIYQFENISFDESIVFDTDSSFYHIQGVNNPHASKRKIIKSIYDNFRPFETRKIGAYKVTFSFWYYSKQEVGLSKERTILYKTNTDELIQDLDEKDLD